jgi:hypothetical protein
LAVKGAKLGFQAVDGTIICSSISAGTGWTTGRVWTVFIVIAIVGAAYFLLVQRRKPAHLQTPEGEVFAAEVPEAPPATST